MSHLSGDFPYHTAKASILRLALWQRLAAVAVVIAALWGGILWAMT
jgi:hypothetical protein